MDFGLSKKQNGFARSARFALAFAGIALAGCSKGPTLPYSVVNPTTVAALSFAEGNTYEYGQQFIDSNVDHPFTLNNTGTGPATSINVTLFVSVFQFKGGTYPGTGATCTTTLAAGASCTMMITYTASYQSDLSTNLTVGYNDGKNSQTLTGPLIHGKAIYSATATLDTTLNGTGDTTASFGPADNHGRALALQSDNRIVVVGYAFDGSKNDFALARYNADGTLDAGFGSAGKVLMPIGAGDDFASSVALQSDGHILVAGWTMVSGVAEMALARFNVDGTLDTTFAANGKAILAIGTLGSYAEGVAVQADNKIILAGYTTNASNHTIVVTRYNANGSLDTGFGTTGIATPVVGADDLGRAVIVQTDQNIVVAGTTSSNANDIALVRLTPTGALDLTFGSSGKVTTDIAMGSNDQAWGLIMQPDGRLVVSGSSNSSGQKYFALLRYTGLGALDVSFGTGGRFITPVGSGDAEAYGVAVQTDGKIVAGGYSTAGSERDFAVVRVSASGALDPVFGTNGKATLSFGPQANVAYGITLSSVGKILLVGDISAGGNFDLGLSRIWP